jgi:hypothetical protein
MFCVEDFILSSTHRDICSQIISVQSVESFLSYVPSALFRTEMFIFRTFRQTFIKISTEKFMLFAHVNNNKEKSLHV